MKSKPEDVYFHMVLSGVPRSDEDVVTGLCFEHGASGVSENLKFHQESLQYDPVIIETPLVNLDVYFESAPGQEFIDQLQLQYPDLKVVVSEETQKDWNEEWKKGFVEFELVDGIWVVPSWRKAPEEAGKVLSIDPGMAFGTGTHETTRLASRALSEISRELDSGWTILDVGTGTGILAMLALELGAASVVATEIDAVARDVARDNVRNNCKDGLIDIPDFQVESVEAKFSVVMANIIDGVLVGIQKPLKDRLAAEGALLLTGILEEREHWFRENFLLPEGYQWKRRWKLNEWVALMGAPQ